MVNDPLIGQQVGNFRIDSLLGQGGMSRVYLGWDIHLDRPVAIKVISEQYRDNPSYNQRFLREARAMASWQHTNIAQVHSAGIENGMAYFVMEYIQGQDLARLLRQYNSQGLLLPYTEVLRIGRAIASALDYAHRRGIIHRDVKPSNVMIAEDGRVVLTDFGLAMNISEGTLGEVFGSPQYIAPEQARSSAAAVPQSDLYSLGIMLYEMLVGRVPFIDPNPTTLALQHIQQEPPSPLSLNPDLGTSIDAFLRKALSKAPESRFQTGREMMQALERALAGPVAAEATAPMPALRTPGIPAGGNGPAPTASRLPGGLPPRATVRPPVVPPPPARGSPVGRWASGCLLAALLLIAGVVMVVAFNFNNSRQPTPGPTQQAVVDPATPTVTESAVPSQPPEPTTEPTLTLEPTSTSPSTPTITPTPSSTPQVIEIHLYRTSAGNLFLVNRSTTDLPLPPMRFSSRYGEFPASDWEIGVLHKDECAAIWRDKIDKKEPDRLKCDLVGKNLQADTNSKYWTQGFYVDFGEERLGTCLLKENRPCDFRFVLLSADRAAAP